MARGKVSGMRGFLGVLVGFLMLGNFALAAETSPIALESTVKRALTLSALQESLSGRDLRGRFGCGKGEQGAEPVTSIRLPLPERPGCLPFDQLPGVKVPVVVLLGGTGSRARPIEPSDSVYLGIPGLPIPKDERMGPSSLTLSTEQPELRMHLEGDSSRLEGFVEFSSLFLASALSKVETGVVPLPGVGGSESVKSSQVCVSGFGFEIERGSDPIRPESDRGILRVYLNGTARGVAVGLHLVGNATSL